MVRATQSPCAHKACKPYGLALLTVGDWIAGRLRNSGAAASAGRDAAADAGVAASVAAPGWASAGSTPSRQKVKPAASAAR